MLSLLQSIPWGRTPIFEKSVDRWLKSAVRNKNFLMKTKILGEGREYLINRVCYSSSINMFDRNVIYKNKALEVQLQAGPMGSVLKTNRRVWWDKMADKSKGAESRILRVFLSREEYVKAWIFHLHVILWLVLYIYQLIKLPISLHINLYTRLVLSYLFARKTLTEKRVKRKLVA